MRIAIDLDDRSLRTWAGQTISTLTAKRRDRFPVEVRFLRGGVAQELATGATGTLGVKVSGDYTADFLASATEWVKSGTGTGTTYTFDLTLNTTEMATAFTADPESVAASVEVEWLQGTTRESSLATSLTVSNDIVRGDEGVPTDATPAYPLPAEIMLKADYAAASIDIKVTVADQAARFALTTASVQNGDFVKQTDSGITYEVVDQANLGNANGYSAIGGSLTDAPSDTKQYARKDGAWVEVVGGGSYILKSASFTAEISKSYALDTTADSFDVTLPASPTEGQEVCFCDARGTWNTHPPTFLRNGNKIEGQEINFTDSAQGTFFCMVFIDAATGWRILESGTKPQNLIVPEITGHYVGVAFTTTNGSWTGSPTTFSYQWQLSADGSTGWADIEGATGATYTPVSLDETKFVRVLVTATNANGSSLPASSLASVEIEVMPFPAGAVAHWRLNETSGVRVDATGNGYDLTDNNSVGYAAGKIGNAADFDGTNYLVADINIFAGKTEFSFSGWVKTTATGLDFIGGEGPNSSGGGGQHILASHSGTSNSFGASLGLDWSPIGGTTVTNDGEWHHCILTFNAGTAKIYIDGDLENTVSGLDSPLPDSGATISTFGADNAAYTIRAGLFDSVTVWSRALSAAEVTMLYNNGNAVDYPA